MTIFVGNDWAEDHHDIHLMGADGTRLASRRLPEGRPAFAGSMIWWPIWCLRPASAGEELPFMIFMASAEKMNGVGGTHSRRRLLG